MSNLFQHLTPGFEQVVMILELVLIHVQPISAFLPLAFSKCPNYFMILPLVLIKFKPMPIFYHCFQATAQPISAFPLVCNRCSAYFSSSPWVFIYFFHSQDWFSSVFSSVLCLINFHHCVIVFSLFMFSHVHFVHHLLSFWHCHYMVFIVIYCFINFDHV